MNGLKTIFLILTCLLLLIPAPSKAVTVLYEISGELSGSFSAVSRDPFADLLNVPRGSSNILPFNLQLVIDTNHTPYVEYDTSVLQQVTYRQAIVSCVLNLNGTEFKTLRSPLPLSSDSPPPNMNRPNDEGNIEILNYVDSLGHDSFYIDIGQYLPDVTSLFNDYTIPINQTIKGIFYDDAIVGLSRLMISLSKTGLLDGIGIPSENSSFYPIPLGANIGVDLIADWGSFVSESIRLSGATGILGGISDFSISIVPPCTYTISPTIGNFSSSAGTSSVSVTASSTSCAWTASENLDWVSLSPSSGTGNGTVTVTATANTDAARNGSITLAGQIFTIGQQAGVLTRTTTVLTNTSPNHIITASNDAWVYGTASSNQIVLEIGAKAELINFPGQNSIEIQSSSDLFTVSRSGTIVTFEGSDGTILKIPATTSVQTVDFSDRLPTTLSIHGGQVMLDDQVVTATAAAIDGESGLPLPCGAYVAPGVWKEFDCYNLAAIGKTTGDDPFTPSWRLIGGYWQWGRKGPDPSQWYNTNTEHFAHGPTGPGSAEANEGEISGWDDDYAPDNSWSDSEKTANDPCPDGYRVPTESRWDGVIDEDNNTQSTVGTWDSDYTNYSTARFFGDDLMLPSTGERHYFSGSLDNRGNDGFYWSSTENSSYSNNAWYLYFHSSNARMIGGSHRRYGFSVRCVAE